MKKILMLFYSFAPQNNCASIPNSKLVKYLEHENVEITLITNAITEHMDIDESLLSENIRNLRRINVHNGKCFMMTLEKQRQIITDNGIKLKLKSETRPIRRRISSFLKNTYFILKRWDWVLHATKLIRHEFKDEHFDVLYSSYPSLSTHYVAKYLMNKNMADKWIADFRDPIGYAEYNNFEYKRYRGIQKKIVRDADAVTVVSEGAMEKFFYEDIPQQKIIYLPNGFDPEDYDIGGICKNSSPGMFRLFYAGSLYAGKRDLSPLFKAISELYSEKLIDISKCSIEYAGNEWPILLSVAKKFGIDGICKDYGYITRKSVLEIMSKVDCNIVCSHNTVHDKGVVTGKIFELLLVGKPIIAVIGGDVPKSELGSIVNQCTAGVVYERGNHAKDFELLKKWVYDRYNEKMFTGGVNSMLDVNQREQYSYVNIAHRLYQVILDVSQK